LPLPPECYEDSKKCNKVIMDMLNRSAMLYLPGLENLAESHGFKLIDFYIIPNISAALERYGRMLNYTLEGEIKASAYLRAKGRCPDDLSSFKEMFVDNITRTLQSVIEDYFEDVVEKVDLFIGIAWDEIEVVLEGCSTKSLDGRVIEDLMFQS